MLNKKFLIFIFLFLSIGILLTLYFANYSKHNTIVTILHEDEPTKIKPENPGGLVIPNSETLVYDKLHLERINKNEVQILHNTEEPITIMVTKNEESEAVFIDSIDEILANIEHYEKKIITENSSEIDDKDHIIMPNDLSKAAEETTQTEEEKKQLENNDITSKIKTDLKIIKSTDDRYRKINLQANQAKEDGYKIQLSSAHSLADANKQWVAIKKKHSKILGSANLITKKIEGKNERIFYLVMAGTYPSLNQAKMVCKKLFHSKQNCIIIK